MAKSSRSKSIKKKNVIKREKLTKATTQRLAKIAEKLNEIVHGEEDVTMTPLFPTDEETLATAKVVLDPTREEEAMEGIEVVSKPSTNIGKNKRKKVGRK